MDKVKSVSQMLIDQPALYLSICFFLRQIDKMENIQIKIDTSNLMRPIGPNITKDESDILIKNDSLNSKNKNSVKRRKLDKDFHSDSISKNNKPKDLDDVIYYFEDGNKCLYLIQVFIYLFIYI